MKTKLLLFSLLVLAAGFAGTQSAAPKPEDHFTVVKVAEGVSAAIAKTGGLASGNSGYVVVSEGVLVVDTTFTPVAVEDLLSVIASETRAPIKYAINTHYHLDHSGGTRCWSNVVCRLSRTTS